MIDKAAEGYEEYTKIEFSPSKYLAYQNKKERPISSLVVSLETPCYNLAFQSGPENPNLHQIYEFGQRFENDIRITKWDTRLYSYDDLRWKQPQSYAKLCPLSDGKYQDGNY